MKHEIEESQLLELVAAAREAAELLRDLPGGHGAQIDRLHNAAAAFREIINGVAGRPNWKVECMVCGDLPTVGSTELCGPCCFGESETRGGNW